MKLHGAETKNVIIIIIIILTAVKTSDITPLPFIHLKTYRLK
jgi:hypothetical protein